MPNPIVPLGANYTLLVYDSPTKKWGTQPTLSSQTYLECMRDAERTARFSTIPMRFAIQYDMPGACRLQVVLEEFTLEPGETLIN